MCGLKNACDNALKAKFPHNLSVKFCLPWGTHKDTLLIN